MADEDNDLLNPDEIEALLNSAAAGSPSSGERPAENSEPAASEAALANSEAPNGVATDETLLDPSDIEALLQQRDSIPAPQAPAETAAEQLLNQAETDLAAALAPNVPPELGAAAPFEFRDFSNGEASNTVGIHLSALQDVELDLRIELGRTELLIEEVTKLKEGSVVPLDKLAGDPVDILVNDRLIARGEVLVLNDNFCVRVAEILTPDF